MGGAAGGLVCAIGECGFPGGGEEPTAEGILMVIHRLAHLLPRKYPARLPHLTHVGIPPHLEVA